MKPQNVRLLDVFLIGPMMVLGGMKLYKKNNLLGGGLFITGIGTVVYNGNNYLRIASGNALPGGHADKHRVSSFDPLQLRKGIKVEMEHTNDSSIAREIAMDHLVEDPRYYDKLTRAGL